MRCRKAESLLVAAADGEITSRERHALDRHLAGCTRCRAAQVSTEDVLARLDLLAPEAPVPAPLEQRVLREVRILAAEEAERGGAAGWWEWLRGATPALAAVGVVALAIVGVRSGEMITPAPTGPAIAPAPVASAPPTSRRPSPVARRPKARAPEEPPAELAERPDLFIDLGILNELDKLQHFDAIATMEGDEDQADPAAEAHSNG